MAPEGKAFACQLGIDRDGLVPGHFELVEAVHRQGAKVALQIHHGGGRADPALTGGVLLAPSPVAQDTSSVVPREATVTEIEAAAAAYAASAKMKCVVLLPAGKNNPEFYFSQVLVQVIVLSF